MQIAQIFTRFYTYFKAPLTQITPEVNNNNNSSVNSTQSCRKIDKTETTKKNNLNFNLKLKIKIK